MIVDLTIADQRGVPIPGVYAQVLNDSGSTGGTTDASGHVSIGPLGETEFTGLRLNNISVVARPHSDILPGSPDVAAGLQVKVVVKNKSAIGL